MSTPSRQTLHDTVMAYYAAVDDARIEDLLDVFTDDVVYHRPGYEPLRGRDAMRAFYVDERVIVSGKHVIDHVVIDGAVVSVQGRFTGVLKDGSRRSVRFADFYRFDPSGRASERRTYFDAPSV